jgi:pyruvate/2-oxoglutarate dehydrogenase complex dihydrolipoamide dehydrogenase (E3) component
MDTFDFVIIGAGAAGEAAAFRALARGASVVIIDRRVLGTALTTALATLGG